MKVKNIRGNIRVNRPRMARWANFSISATFGDNRLEDNNMMLALVNSERQRREELRMIIHPLSEDFIHGSPEALPTDSYRLQPYAQDSVFSHATNIKYQG